MHVCHVYEFIAEYCNNVCVLHMCVLTEIRSPIENAARVPKEKLQMKAGMRSFRPEFQKAVAAWGHK
jgi:hypothetical protein